MNEGDPVAVETINRDHVFHPRRRNRFHDRGIGNNGIETRLYRLPLLIFAFPIPGQGLQLLEGGGRMGSSDERCGTQGRAGQKQTYEAYSHEFLLEDRELFTQAHLRGWTQGSRRKKAGRLSIS